MDVPLALNPSGCARCEPRFRTLIKHRYRPLIMPSPKKKATGQVNTDKFNPELLPREARSKSNFQFKFFKQKLIFFKQKYQFFTEWFKKI